VSAPTLSRQQLGVIPIEQCSHVLQTSITSRVNFLNQPINCRRHDQKIPHSFGTRIPISVSSPTRHQHARARRKFDLGVTHTNPQGSFKHIPCFVIASMQVQRSNIARRICRASRVLPLGNDEITASRAEYAASKGRNNDRGPHKVIKSCLGRCKSRSGPGGIIFTANLPQVLGNLDRNAGIVSEKRVKTLQPENLAVEYCPKIPRKRVRDPL
jgi:hypothetical protein